MSRLIQPIHAELRQVIFDPPLPARDLYILVCATQTKQRHGISLVHVSPKLKQLFDRGTVRAFDLHHLRLNGLAMQVLSAQPEFLVTAVQLEDGSVSVDVPAVLPRVRDQALAQAAWLALPGLAGVSMGMYWSLLVLLPCAWLLRNALQVPTGPHPELARHRAPRILGPKAQECTTNSAADSISTT